MRLGRGIVLVSLTAAACGGAASVDGDLATAIAEASPGAVLDLGSGEFTGPIVIDKAITLVGDGALIRGGDGQPTIVIEDATGVTLRGLTVRGGESGLLIRDSEAVTLEDVTVVESLWHGMLVQDSEVHVDGCRVSGLRAAMAQGIEIINSDSRPPSTIRSCRIEGPVFEGLVAHVSHVTFERNEVVGASQRGVVITEMSDGRMAENSVIDSAGAAYFCGDMSNCSIVDNTAEGIEAGDGRLSAMGHGVVVHYYSQAFIDGLEVEGLTGQDVLAILGGRMVDESPYP